MFEVSFRGMKLFKYAMNAEEIVVEIWLDRKVGRQTPLF